MECRGGNCPIRRFLSRDDINVGLGNRYTLTVAAYRWFIVTNVQFTERLLMLMEWRHCPRRTGSVMMTRDNEGNKLGDEAVTEQHIQHTRLLDTVHIFNFCIKHVWSRTAAKRACSRGIPVFWSSFKKLSWKTGTLSSERVTVRGGTSSDLPKTCIYPDWKVLLPSLRWTVMPTRLWSSDNYPRHWGGTKHDGSIAVAVSYDASQCSSVSIYINEVICTCLKTWNVLVNKYWYDSRRAGKPYAAATYTTRYMRRK